MGKSEREICEDVEVNGIVFDRVRIVCVHLGGVWKIPWVMVSSISVKIRR